MTSFERQASIKGLTSKLPHLVLILIDKANAAIKVKP